MKRTCRRLRPAGPLAVIGIILLTCWAITVHGQPAPSAASSPLKLLVSSESGLAFPGSMALPPIEDMNDNGDYVFAAGSYSALFLRRATDSATRRLLQEGDPVPGLPHSRVEMLSGPRINQSGLVCVRFEYFEAYAIKSAIFTHDASGFHKIVLATDIAPGSARSVFGRMTALVGVNDSGDVAFTAPLVPIGYSPVLPAHTAVFIAPAGGAPVIRIAGQGDPAPDTGGTLDALGSAQFNNRGEVLFRATIVGGSGGSGLFIGSPASVRKVVAAGDANLRGGAFDAAMAASGLWLNNAGAVAFYNNNALYTVSPAGVLSLIVQPGVLMPAPIGTSALQAINSLGAFNDAGQVVLAVTVSNLSGGGNNAVLRCTPGVAEPDVIAWRNQAAPGTTRQTMASFGTVLMNGGGDVSFYASLVPTEPPVSSGGLFKKPDGAALAPVMLNGQLAPPAVGGTYNTTGYSRLLDDGSLYFESDLVGGSATFAAFHATAAGVKILATAADPLPAGSRVMLRNLFMSGAGGYTAFSGRRAGGGGALFTHDVATGVTRRAAADGDGAPIPAGGVIAVGNSGGRVQVSDDGAVLFPATVSSVPSGAFLFSWSPSGGLTKLVGPGDSPAGTSAVFTSCSLASVLVPPFNQDTIVFRGNLNNGTNGIFLIPRSGGQAVTVMLSTDWAPTGGPFGAAPTVYYINQPGQVAFLTKTSRGISGIFVGSADSFPVKVAAVGDPAPDGGTFSAFATAGPAGFLDDGRVIFFATVTGGSSGFFAGTADGTLQAIALNGIAAPAGGNYAFTGTSRDARANAQGDILFQAPLTGGTADSGLFLRRASTGLVETVALQGQPVPGRTAVFDTFQPTLNNYPGENCALGPTGEVMFTTSLEVPHGLRTTGAFRYRGPGTLETILVRTDVAPESGGGAVAYISQGPGAGGVGLFFLAVDVIDGTFADGIYSVTMDTTPAGAVRSLSNLAWSYNLNPGIANSLNQKLEGVLKALGAGKAGQRRDAANKLGAFINFVEGQRGKGVTNAQADELVGAAKTILAMLG